MEESKQEETVKTDKPIDADGFSAMSVVYLFMRYKILVVIFVSLATIASVFISLNMDNWYSSTINLVPPKQANTSLQGSLGGISSALKDFGLTKLGGKAGVEMYDLMVIIDSRTVKDSMIKKYKLASTYDIPDTMTSDIIKEFESNLDITFESEGNYTITIWDKDPQRAAAMTRDYVAFVNNLAKTISHRDAAMNREYLEQRIKKTDSSIIAITDTLQKYSKKYFIFAPEEQAASITKALSEIKAELVKQEVTYNMIQNRYGEKDPYAMMQKDIVEELKRKVSNIENKPGFGGNFSIRNSLAVGAEFLRLYAELETSIKVKSFLLPVIEEARLEEIKNTISLTVVDEALPADKKARPKRSFYVLGAAFGSFILCVLFIVIINGYRNFKFGYNSYKRKHAL